MVTDPSTGIKHAFVTGATGIVGVPLCQRLVEMGIRVTAFSRTAGDFGLPESVHHVLGDVLDESAVFDAAEGADVIFHVAAAVHGTASTQAEFDRLNVAGTEKVIDVAHDLGAKLVHVSTVNVAGYRRGELDDAYAASKSRAEQLVADAVAEGLDAVIVRPATVFGNQAGNAGMIIDQLLSGTLAILPAPSRRFSPVWSGDLASALIRAAESGETGRTYTVAGPPTSTGKFVKSVCASAGVGGPRLFIPGWMFAVPLQLAWWGKAITRWTPPVSVESLVHGSEHDGSQAAKDLGFSYTPIAEIFG